MQFLFIDKVETTQSHTMNTYHSHAHYEIYILTQGKRTVLFNNNLKELNAPACIIFPPSTVHRTEGSSYKRYNINIAPAYLDNTQKELLRECELYPFHFTDSDIKAIVPLLNLIIQAQTNQTVHSDYIIKSLLNSILAIIYSHTKKSSYDIAKKQLPYMLVKLISFLENNYQEKITLDLLSQQFCIAKTTIIYNFKKYLQCSPMDYLLKIRLNKVKELLLSPTKIGIEEISERCGFSCAHYLTEIFKKKEGMTPSAYRKFLFQYK